eukprot:Sdes_comp25179_c0_seq1m22687
MPVEEVEDTVVSPLGEEALSNSSFDKIDISPPATTLVGYDKIYKLESGFELLTCRLKQDIKTCREVLNYLKKKLILEEEYAKNCVKLNRNFIDAYCRDADMKQGTFEEGYVHLLEVSEKMG